MSGTLGDTFADRAGSLLKNRGRYYPLGKIPSSVNLPVTVKTPVFNINTSSKVLKAARVGGKIVAGAGLVITGYQIYDDVVNKGKFAKAGARTAVALTATGAAFIPVVGWGVSLGIGVADYVWGDDFYDWVDKQQIGGN